MDSSHSLVRLSPKHSLVAVIDAQEKLVAALPDAGTLIRNIRFLLEVARKLEVPILATEQYPQGLGATVPELASHLPNDLPAKKDFSCCGAMGFEEELLQYTHRRQVVLTGMESHVCVLQTALDLLEGGWTIFIVADAVASRFSLDHDLALRRMERAGAILTTSETVAFEWLASADHPNFKEISKLVRARTEPNAIPFQQRETA